MTSTRTSSGAGHAGPPAIDRLLGMIVDIAGWGAAISGFALVLVVGGNVLARYVFSTGSVAMQELEWYLVSPIALLGMAYGVRHGGHVRVDFLYDRLGHRARAGVDFVSALLMVALGIGVIWFSLPYVGQSVTMAEGSPDPGGLPYRFLLKSFIPAGFFLLTVQAIAQALINWRDMLGQSGMADMAGDGMSGASGAGTSGAGSGPRDMSISGEMPHPAAGE